VHIEPNPCFVMTLPSQPTMVAMLLCVGLTPLVVHARRSSADGVSAELVLPSQYGLSLAPEGGDLLLPLENFADKNQRPVPAPRGNVPAGRVGSIEQVQVDPLLAQPKPSKQVKVMSWNILAREHTRHNKNFHKNTHPDDGGKETKAMTSFRYASSVTEILRQKPDIAFLQEVEPSFLDTTMNMFLPELRKVYNLFPDPRGKWNNRTQKFKPYPCEKNGCCGQGPGVLALTLKEFPFPGKLDQAFISSISTTKKMDFGGCGKSAVVVKVPDVGSFVGVHLGWVGDKFLDDFVASSEANAKKRKLLLDSAVKKVGPAGPSCVLGDFNVDPTEAQGAKFGKWSEVEKALEGFDRRSSFSGVTGLHTDFKTQVTIDHVFCRGFLLPPENLEIGPVVSPYIGLADKEWSYKGSYFDIEKAPPPMSSASDHAWMTANIKVP